MYTSIEYIISNKNDFRLRNRQIEFLPQRKEWKNKIICF